MYALKRRRLWFVYLPELPLIKAQKVFAFIFRQIKALGKAAIYIIFEAKMVRQVEPGKHEELRNDYNIYH